jgi:hypothetical protein
MSPLKEQPSQYRQELTDIAISISNFEGSIIWLDGSVVKWR